MASAWRWTSARNPIASGVPVIRVAIVAGVTFPGDSVTSRPLPIGLRADVQRHADAITRVVAGAAHLRHVPTRSEVSRPPFAVRFESPARKHNNSGKDGLLRPIRD